MKNKDKEIIYEKMSKLNKEIQSLFLKYLDLNKQLVELKKEKNLSISDLEYEKEVKKLIKENDNVLIRKFYQPINEQLFLASNALQKDLLNSDVIYEQTIRIAYFGIGKSNTYLSLCKMLKEKGYRYITDYSLYKNQKEIELIETSSIDDLKEKIITREVDYAFVPYVNSNTGVIADTHQLMRNVRFAFKDIYTDAIVLYLYIAKRNAEKIKDFYDIETIYSNIPALNQCSDFVNAYTPFATYRQATSTTQSIECMLNDKNNLAACFANEKANENKNIIRFKNKVTSNNNVTYTKYLLISPLKNASVRKKEQDLRNYFIGYFLYASERKEGKVHSVDAKSYRAVKIIKDNNNQLCMSIYTFGNKTKKIAHSIKTSVFFDEISNEIVLKYNYAGETANSSVNGVAYLRATENVLRNPNKRIYGTYEGLSNGKSGKLEFRRISQKEFILLTEVTE